MGEMYSGEIRELAKEIYERRKGISSSPDLLKATAKLLMEAITAGYGKDLIHIDWNTPDHAMLSKLTQNVFAFSAAKNYQQLQDITDAMKGDDGKLLEFSDYLEAVNNLNAKYNRDWLETEYGTAVASATSSARWIEFTEEAGIMPMLQYQTAGDSRVRPEHASLNGTRKPIDDDFWKTYYPPNGWNCRCEAVQVPESNAAEVEPAGFPPVNPMFRTNLAESGLIFPKNHPYYTGVPKDVLRRSMQYIPPNFAFRTVPAGKSGAYFEEHAMLQWEPEAKGNRNIAKMLVENGYKNVKLMPRLHEKEADLREKLYGKNYADRHKTKCPDCFAGGKPVEFKTATRNLMSKRIHEASIQADIIVLKCKEKLTDDYVARFINGQWKHADRLNVKQIIIVNDGKMQTFKRP
jgi:SPP1 gp7 family putative phage head morphogenesis protein